MMSDENTLAEAPGEEAVVNLDQPETPSVEGGAEDEASEKSSDDTEAAGDEAGAEDVSEDDKPKKLSGSRRERIRNEMLRRENAELHRRLEAEARPANPAEIEKEPQEADFNGDFFAYQQALTSFNVRKTIREENARAEASRRSGESNDLWRERVIEHRERVEDARSEIADYDKVLGSSRIPVSDDVGREIILSDKSALLSYYLAKNPDKLEALNRMSGRELAREIGRLEGSVRMPSANRKTNAPAPIAQLKGGASPAFDPAKASMDDYIAKRKAGWSG